jgi:hypothetical protein
MLRAMTTYLKDLLERVVATFVMAYLGVALSSAPDGGLSIKASDAALIAGIAAVGSLIKGIAAKRLGTPDTASLTV